MELFSYYRSSASYRVRIALRLKGVDVVYRAVNLVENEQRGGHYLTINEQGLVPSLRLDDGSTIAQSPAILDWLEDSFPSPALYPSDTTARARYRALCQHIGCDIHPLNNLRVLRYLREEFAADASATNRWYAHWIDIGFASLEPAARNWRGKYSLGERPGMFEVYLVPQLYNARRFDVPLEPFPALLELESRCLELAAFTDAHPGRQPDAPTTRP